MGFRMLYIFSDDYFFAQGVSGLLKTEGIKSTCFLISEKSDNSYISRLRLTLDDACMIAIECETLRKRVCELIAKQTNKVCFVYDFRVGDIISLLPDCGFLSKRSQLHEFLTVLNSISFKENNWLSLTTEDDQFLDLYISGINLSMAASKVGRSVKRCYGRKYEILDSKGISRRNAYSILLLKKIASSNIYFKER